MDIDKILLYGTRLVIIFMCIPVHECAHAWMGVKMGDDTPIHQGRLTLNPIKHIDPIGALGILLCGFGWGKPVQVNPLRFKQDRKGMALTAAAGPVSNLLMALIATVIYKFIAGAYLHTGNMALFWLTSIFTYFVYINIGLAVFNLIPVAPLDGQKIFAYFLSDKFNAWIEQYQMYISLAIIGLVTFTHLLDKPMAALEGAVYDFMDLITFWADPIVKAIFKV